LLISRGQRCKMQALALFHVHHVWVVSWQNTHPECHLDKINRFMTKKLIKWEFFSGFIKREFGARFSCFARSVTNVLISTKLCDHRYVSLTPSLWLPSICIRAFWVSLCFSSFNGK
jgi:hypothetical protein